MNDYARAERELERVEEIERGKMQNQSNGVGIPVHRASASCEFGEVIVDAQDEQLAQLAASDALAQLVSPALDRLHSLPIGVDSRNHVERDQSLSFVTTGPGFRVEVLQARTFQRAQAATCAAVACLIQEVRASLEPAPSIVAPITNAPLDRTRAIVEAAEALGASIDDLGTYIRTVQSEWNELPEDAEHQARLDALQAALALPAPEWTRTPPSAPGDYYWRSSVADVQPVRVEYGLGPRADASGRSIQVPGLVGYTTGSEEWSLVDDFGGEWWPVPIDPPPAS